MEITDSKKPYRLHAFSPVFSQEELVVDVEVVPENGVEFYLSPRLVVDDKNNMYAFKLDFGFVKDKEPCSNSVVLQIQFLYDSEEKVFVKEKGGLKLANYPVLYQMLDTAVGALRGVLIVKCAGTKASRFVLPFLDLNVLIRQMEIKFLNK